ncbi:MAG: 16S rRNA (cytosine(1402)-N(4))-methyltransferase RsmH [Woeseiaceae bacterium]|nr:16S rRNA (cytosine(1402)-N(4))-methyltransferase RsmH [Gammaproteobacteria bacterium]NNK24596.1 16S rRNA (cytosine(1402)-N(4))-methyltransferase RsmH [Woeseiaceae bacterium]
MGSDVHVPVLLGPVLEGLNIKPGGCYVDGTFGRGGHSRAILNLLGDTGRLIAIDRDPEAISSAPASLVDDLRFELVRAEIAQLETIIRERALIGEVDGLLLDLGVSSPQLDEAQRGFSFLRDGPLDMRMDPEHGRSASEWLAAVDERELRGVLKRYGEETQAARVARAIVRARAASPISRTAQLARIVEEARGGRSEKIHAATRTFQAIRIAINDELRQLEAALVQSLVVMKRGARLCVISFHSLEDRIVKRFMRDASRESEQFRGMPDVPEAHRARLAIVGKPITANDQEVATNRRARSARLRVAERL